jgi:hypothetical protein
VTFALSCLICCIAPVSSKLAALGEGLFSSRRAAGSYFQLFLKMRSLREGEVVPPFAAEVRDIQQTMFPKRPAEYPSLVTRPRRRSDDGTACNEMTKYQVPKKLAELLIFPVLRSRYVPPNFRGSHHLISCRTGILGLRRIGVTVADLFRQMSPRCSGR